RSIEWEVPTTTRTWSRSSPSGTGPSGCRTSRLRTRTSARSRWAGARCDCCWSSRILTPSSGAPSPWAPRRSLPSKRDTVGCWDESKTPLDITGRSGSRWSTAHPAPDPARFRVEGAVAWVAEERDRGTRLRIDEPEGPRSQARHPQDGHVVARVDRDRDRPQGGARAEELDGGVVLARDDVRGGDDE